MKKVLFFLLVMTVIIAGCGAQDASQPPNNTDQAPDQQGIDVNKPEDDTEEEEQEAAEQDDILAVGDTFELKDWEVTLDSFEFEQSVEDDMFSSSADDGNKFLVLRLTVTNNGTSADEFIQMIGGTSIKAIYDEKYEYGITLTMIDGDLSNKRVQPLSDQSGFTVIKVPDKVAEATESLVVNFSLDGEKVKVKIR